MMLTHKETHYIELVETEVIRNHKHFREEGN